MRNQIIRARRQKRDFLLDPEMRKAREFKLVLNVTYHPAYANIKEILEIIHLLLTPDKDQRLFPKVPIVGLKREKVYMISLLERKFHFQKLKVRVKPVLRNDV